MAALPATRGHADGADTVSHSVQQSGGSTEIKHDMSKPASHLPFSEGPVVPELAGAAMGGAVGARLVLGAGAMAGAPALVAGTNY